MSDKLLYCNKHKTALQTFVQHPHVSVGEDFCVCHQTLDAAVNQTRLDGLQQIVDNRGEFNMFVLSSDYICSELYEALKKSSHDANQNFADIQRVFALGMARDNDGAENLEAFCTFCDTLKNSVDQEDSAAVVGRLAAYRVHGAPLQVDLYQNQHGNSIVSMLHIDLDGGTGMNEVLYTDHSATYGVACYQVQFEDIRKKYKDYMQKMLSLHLKMEAAEAKQVALDVYQLEKQVAACHESPVQKRKGSCLIQSIGAIEDPAFKSFVTKYLAEVGGENANQVFNDRLVAYPEVVPKVLHLLASVKNKQTLKHYFMWIALQGFAKFALPSQYNDLYASYYLHAERGQRQLDSKWLQVISFVRDEMSEHSNLLMIKYGPDNSTQRKEAKNMIQKLIETAAEEVSEVDHWPNQTAESKAILTKHIRALKVQVGYPDNIEKVTYTWTGNSFLTCMLDIGVTQSVNICAKVKAQPQVLSWAMKPLQANACYNPSTHTITMTESMCLYPFAGQLARFITGHEITHCFDDQGVAFLQEFSGKPKQGFQRLCGAMKQWSNAQCNANCCADAELTLGENTADLIGFRICLRHFLNAFERDMHRDVSKKELMQFYVDYAAMWASRCSPQIKMMRKIRDAHEDPPTRILMATTPLPPCPCQDKKSNV